jgi:hypothetical protein
MNTLGTGIKAVLDDALEKLSSVEISKIYTHRQKKHEKKAKISLTLFLL